MDAGNGVGRDGCPAMVPFVLVAGREKPRPLIEFAWALINGPIPYGQFVCHHCDNPPCINPAHLFLGTPHANVMDARAKGRLAARGVRGVKVMPHLRNALSREGSHNPRAKLSENDVVKIRSRYAVDVPQKDLAKEYGVAQTTISAVIRNVNWQGSQKS